MSKKCDCITIEWKCLDGSFHLKSFPVDSPRDFMHVLNYVRSLRALDRTSIAVHDDSSYFQFDD